MLFFGCYTYDYYTTMARLLQYENDNCNLVYIMLKYKKTASANQIFHLYGDF
jgi:hypothetical protein